MYGVIKGLKLCNQDRVEQLNERIYSRYVPNISPQMQFDPRPTPTKYTLFPISGATLPVPTPVIARPSYNVATSFLPGDSAPWNGFDVNQESKLKNIIFALQSCPQAAYVPSSNSDMFHRSTGMFQGKTPSSSVVPTKSPIVSTPSIFYNDTRQQIKDT